MSNQLFSISLIVTLLGSFVATMGRYWLTSYISKCGGGLDHERWIQLNRSIAADSWGLAYFLESVLPLTILIALALFATGFAFHLDFLKLSGSDMINEFLVLVAAYLLGGLCYRLKNPFFPYQTPLEVLLRAIWTLTISIYRTYYQPIEEGLSSFWNWLGVWTTRTIVDPMKLLGLKLSTLQPQPSQEPSNSREGRRRTVTRSGGITGHINLQVEPITVERE